jgi:hypothetical protein
VVAVSFKKKTTLGRFTGVFVMLAGVGIIGALASILASLLVSPAPAKSEETAPGEAEAGGVPASQVPPAADRAEPVSRGIGSELAKTRAELARTRAEMADLRHLIATFSPPGHDREAAIPEG